MSEINTMNYYEVTLKFFIKYTEYEEVNNPFYEDRIVPTEDEFNKSMNDTRVALGSMRERIMEYDIQDMFECICSYGEVVLNSESWITEGEETPDHLGLGVKFVLEVDSSVAINEIEDDLLFSSLEDGCYEGINNGWTFMTSDEKYEYCLLDYRLCKNIIVKKCLAPHTVI